MTAGQRNAFIAVSALADSYGLGSVLFAVEEIVKERLFDGVGVSEQYLYVQQHLNDARQRLQNAEGGVK